MAVVTMRQLLESGVHFGHQTRRWNPKMKRFIFTERNGIYIVDLQQTLTYIDSAFEFVKDTVARGGTVLFVGTKRQAQEPVAEQAARVGMPYVNQRWLGGMLTNFATVNKRLQRLKELEEIDFDDAASSSFTKKELLIMRREKDKLAKTLGGIRDMARVPAAVWIVDTNKEHLAVDEARKLGVPVIAILDTNCDPDMVDFAIPGNDDAIRSVTLLTRVIADAVAEGLLERHARRTGEAEPGAPEPEPLAEWERELLAGAEAPAAEAEAPAAEADASAEPETPAAEPETPAAEPETPAAEADASAAEADASAEPETPAAEPEAPAEEAPAEADARAEAEAAAAEPVKKPAPKKPAPKEPVAEEPVAEEPVAEEPAPKKPAADAPKA